MNAAYWPALAPRQQHCGSAQLSRVAGRVLPPADLLPPSSAASSCHSCRAPKAVQLVVSWCHSLSRPGSSGAAVWNAVQGPGRVSGPAKKPCEKQSQGEVDRGLQPSCSPDMEMGSVMTRIHAVICCHAVDERSCSEVWHPCLDQSCGSRRSASLRHVLLLLRGPRCCKRSNAGLPACRSSEMIGSP